MVRVSRQSIRWRPVAPLAFAAALVVVACGAPGSEGVEYGGDPLESSSAESLGETVPGEESQEASVPYSWGPSLDDFATALAEVESWTPEQAAGMVLMPRFAGRQAPIDLIERLELGSVILFGDNASTREQTVELITQSRKAGALLVGVDNEGGRVQRLRAPEWTDVPAFCHAASDPALTTAVMSGMGQELHETGVDITFAPVADVVTQDDVTIGSRSAGSDPQLVTAAVLAAIEGLDRASVISVVKHFPGHGSLGVDSHLGLPVLDATQAELDTTDLIPFVAAIDAGVPVVMMGHIAVTAWDPGAPASLSEAAYEYLRDDLGFTGVVATDALDMGAITEFTGGSSPSVLALRAGADLIVSPANVEAEHAAIVAALASGELDRERLDEAAARVLTLARWHHRDRGQAEAVGLADAEGESLEELTARYALEPCL